MKVLFCICLLCCPLLFFSQTLNRLNRHGEKTGRWINYADSAKTIKLFEGKFRRDKPIGKNYFYTNAGVLDRIEVVRFKKLKTTFFHPNAAIRMKGNARLENLPDRIHYYFYGRWNVYNDSGKLEKYYYYNKGQHIKTVYIDKNKKINDSLIQALTLIDQEFTSHNTLLTDSINANLRHPERYHLFKRELAVKDSMSFAQIDRILDTYGYPSKAIAGDASGIPFYILGYAPVPLKEKHMGQLMMAASREDISWKSLAFFIDKLKLAKNEKQVYGTQYFLRKGEYVMYPIEDEANLKARRSSVGLEND